MRKAVKAQGAIDAFGEAGIEATNRREIEESKLIGEHETN